MNDSVMIDANDWHMLCYSLNFYLNRKEQFQDYFNCTVTWKSRLDTWPGEDVSERPNPVMILRFTNPQDAVVFALKHL